MIGYACTYQEGLAHCFDGSAAMPLILAMAAG
jgi:hypothetical protein